MYNRYRHLGKVFVCKKMGKSEIIIHSKERIVQGCILSMDIYGVATPPLMHNMRVAVPQSLQPWFADDSGATGNAVHNAECLEYRFGYYMEPGKSRYICKKED